MKLIRMLLEIIGWLQIVTGTMLAAALPALFIYRSWPSAKLPCIMLVVAGFIAGTIWATRIWKKEGTIAWLSSIRRTS